MATTVSPTPVSTTYGNLYRRPSNRQIARTGTRRPILRRNSPLSAPAIARDSVSSALVAPNTGDSSDDDVPGYIIFSAEVKALLGEDASSIGTSPVVADDGVADSNHNGNAGRQRLSDQLRNSRSRSGSPLQNSNGSPAPRVVRIGSGPRSFGKVVERDGSFQYQNIGRASEPREGESDLITPAPRARSVRVNGLRLYSHSPPENGLGSNGQASSGRTAKRSERQTYTDEVHDETSAERIAQTGSGTVTRARHAEDAAQLQSTMRIKRVAGVFLDKPVRRGVIRRQSEEDEVPQSIDDRPPESENESPQPVLVSRSDSPKAESKPYGPPEDLISFAESQEEASHHVAFASKEVVVQPDGHLVETRAISPRPVAMKAKSTPASGASQPSSNSSSTRIQPVFKVLPLPLLPSQHDQENEPPPTFKRTKPSARLLDKVGKITVLHDDKHIRAIPATISPVRKPLAARSQNTPHRAPPPPPKMSVLETATVTAGAAATSSQQRKKRNHISVKSTVFTRLDCIGRGGSSRVYRVMAENYKIFALKRVNLEDADPTSVVGYKGEIDLLLKLKNNDRVVQLFDYEINDEKQTLSVLMEVGESDLYRILNQKLKTENAKLDLSFTRYYWKEMLECVNAVHQHDIVHSDLKPSNFLLVQGRLKLIDFGIANAIADDTINIHREIQVGTPNYMSPEHLVDCNSAHGLPSSAGRLLKLGRPSDVWSLGCILYQMVYGQPPFAHITKTYERLMSIPNPRVLIDYPSTGVGGVPVPAGLVRTLRRCLQRDQNLRPTLDELLSDRNEFLHPNPKTGEDATTVPVSQEMLRRILHNVVDHCRSSADQVPGESDLSRWASSYFGKIKQLVEEEDMRP